MSKRRSQADTTGEQHRSGHGVLNGLARQPYKRLVCDLLAFAGVLVILFGGDASWAQNTNANAVFDEGTKKIG